MNRIDSLVGLALVVPLLVVGGVRAQERLGYDAYLSRVDERAPVLLASDERIASAAATLGTARIRPVPSLTVGLAQIDVSGEGAPTASLVGVDLPFELGGDRRARRAEATAGVSFTTAEVARDHGRLLVAAALAYVDAVAAEEEFAVRQRLEVGLAEAAALDEMRLTRGEIGESVALRSALERDRARIERQSAEARVATTRIVLGRFLASSEPVAVDTTDAAIDRSSPAEREALIALARASHPEAATADARLELARAAIERVRARRVVDPSLRAEWQHNGRTNEPQFRQRSNDTVALLLTIPMPLTGPRRHELAVAEAELAEAQAMAEAIRLRIASEVDASLALERLASSRAEAYAQELEPRARALFEASSRAYAANATTAFEWIAARRGLEEIALEAIEARVAERRAAIAVRAAVTGRP